ncbi:MAG TPA: amino acid racemase [Hyphomicrobiaceae bacterium]
MQRIGLIGGLTWVSTVEYYRRLNEIIHERLGGANSADLVLASVNREDYARATGRKDEEAARGVLVAAAQRLERAGANFIALCCNGAHQFLPQVEREVSIPFLHIADATARKIQSAGMDRVALLGVRDTMEQNFYPEVLARYGIKTMIPNDAERTYIHDSIQRELANNIFRDETRRHYVEIMMGLQSRGAQGAILGCTEIPLLIRPDDTSVVTFSTTELHCQAIVERALG